MINIQQNLYSFVLSQRFDTSTDIFQKMGEGVGNPFESEFKKILHDLKPQPQNTSHEDQVEAKAPPFNESDNTISESSEENINAKDEYTDSKENDSVKDEENERPEETERIESSDTNSVTDTNTLDSAELEEGIKELLASIQELLQKMQLQAAQQNISIVKVSSTNINNSGTITSTLNKIKASLQKVLAGLPNDQSQKNSQFTFQLSAIMIKQEKVIPMNNADNLNIQGELTRILENMNKDIFNITPKDINTMLKNVKKILNNNTSIKLSLKLESVQFSGELQDSVGSINNVIDKMKELYLALNPLGRRDAKLNEITKNVTNSTNNLLEGFSPKELSVKATEIPPIVKDIFESLKEMLPDQKSPADTLAMIKDILAEHKGQVSEVNDMLGNQSKDFGSQEKPMQMQIIENIAKMTEKVQGNEISEQTTKSKFTNLLDQYLKAEENVMNQVTKNARLFLRPGITRMTIDLNPPDLGKLNLKIEMDNDVLAGKIRVENITVKNIIETNLPQLKETLNNLGITVEKMDVFVKSEGESYQDAYAQLENAFGNTFKSGSNEQESNGSNAFAESSETDDENVISLEEKLGLIKMNDGTIKVNLVG